MSWQQRILRVNLNDGTCTEEPLNMDWAMKYIGQRGLATKYLVEEIDPGAADFPIVTERQDNVPLECVISNSFGFGGTNATLVFKRYDA